MTDKIERADEAIKDAKKYVDDAASSTGISRSELDGDASESASEQVNNADETDKTKDESGS
ncbi:hypothetical protein QMK17_20210 [Rhodococcus sp. G-MC3]|uniref:hypothetical protein n=1 Tax=Rhodococcus sp. G-MC3 TaxID=3046209 RepID=UPI0024B91B6C|nr:hypothetical protein [Rhodococcus sp. G-MC3]MDJ0395649.1 hypothetical protein [Rhodococcus sp. G-MC3]